MTSSAVRKTDAETQNELAPASAADDAGSRSGEGGGWFGPTLSWQRASILIAVAVAIIVALGWEPVSLAAYQWLNSNAYTYCLLIPLISAWLLWERRDELLGMTPRPDWRFTGLMVVPLAMYAVGFFLDINEGMQFALVAAIQVVLMAVLGWTIYWRFAFPFNYLWLIVPTGSYLLWPMQWASTYFSVMWLRWVEVPTFVTWENFYVQVPTGLYEVAEGCAGLNFLLVAIALSTLFAYLTYRSWTARILCVVISIVVSIVANWVRVFGIIYIAHLTDSQAEIVADHLLYGWFYFAFIMFGLMWLGLKIRGKDDPADDGEPRIDGPTQAA